MFLFIYIVPTGCSDINQHYFLNYQLLVYN